MLIVPAAAILEAEVDAKEKEDIGPEVEDTDDDDVVATSGLVKEAGVA